MVRKFEAGEQLKVYMAEFFICLIKEARGSFFGRGVEVLKLQSRIEDQLRSPSYYIMIST